MAATTKHATDDDDEFVELVDFTSVSPWERLISQLERFFRLCNDKADQSRKTQELSWQLHTGRICRVGIELHCRRFPPAQQEYCTSTSFLPNPTGRIHNVDDDESQYSQLHRWTGLESFIILTVNDANGPPADGIGTEKFLQSAVWIALNESQCRLPVFIGVGAEWRQVFSGQWLAQREMEVRFITSFMPYTPHQMSQLDGLISAFRLLFKQSEEITVMAELTFTRDDFDENEDEDEDMAIEIEREPSDSGYRWNRDRRRSPRTPALPVGPRYDPIESISLIASFDAFSVVKEDGSQNEILLDPWKANRWILRAEFDSADDDWRSLSNLTLFPLLRRICLEWVDAVADMKPEATLTESGKKISLGKSVLTMLLGGNGQQDSALMTGRMALVDREQIHNLLLSTFNQFLEDSRRAKIERCSQNDQFIKRWLPRYRSIPYMCLLWRMIKDCMIAMRCQPDQPHLTPSPTAFMSAVWADFMRLIRHCWETKTPIVGILSVDDRLAAADSMGDERNGNQLAAIDLRYCLVQQKLQMLNICIEKLRGPYQSNDMTDKSWLSSGDVEKILFENQSRLHESRSPSPIAAATMEDSCAPKSIHDKPPATKYTSDDESSSSDTDVFYDTIEDSNAAAANRMACEEDFLVAEKTSSMPSGSLPERVRLSSFASSFENITFDRSYRDNESGKPPTRDFTDDASSEDDEYQVNDDPNQRRGRLRPLGDCRLIKTGEPMFVPETQDHGFMTEDMLREMQQVFEQLGTSEEAVRIRAKMQSANLKSDMKAFKAANPGCVLEDFIRWHSPRDLVEDGRGGWTLSSRMTQQSLWQQLWQRARPIPASQQKPLFHAEREGEKALHWLESLSPNDLLQQFLPTFFAVALETLVSSSNTDQLQKSECVKESIEQLASVIQKFDPVSNWNSLPDQLSAAAQTALHCLRRSESLMACAQSLYSKLCDFEGQQEETVEELVDPVLTSMFALDPADPGGLNGGVLLKHETFRLKVSRYFTSNGSKFLQPVVREFILQSLRETCSVSSGLLDCFGQDVDDCGNDGVANGIIKRFALDRMYAWLKEGEFRLIESHSKDLLSE